MRQERVIFLKKLEVLIYTQSKKDFDFYLKQNAAIKKLFHTYEIYEVYVRDIYREMYLN